MRAIKHFFLKMRIKKAVGKYGLKSNHGFMKGCHLNANYDSNGKFFIKAKGNISGIEAQSWKRVSKKEYKKIKTFYEIISCTYCNNPAVTLDHSYPYLIGMTMCKDCFEKNKRKELEIYDG